MPRDARPARLVRIWHTIRMRWLAVLLSVACTGALAAAGPQPPSVGVLIRISGDLDTRRIADRIVETVETAANDANTAGIGFELAIERSRPDLLYDVVDAVRDADVPTASVLSRGSIRAPAFLLALATDRAALAAGSTWDFSGGGELQALAPSDTEWTLVRLDLQRMAQRLSENKGLHSLAAELVAGTRDVFLAADGSLSLDPNVGERSRRSQSRGRADADRLTRLATAMGMEVARRPDVWIRQRLEARRVEVVAIESDLRVSHRRCLELLDAAIRAIARAEHALDLSARPGDPSHTASDLRRAAESARHALGQAEQAIRDVAGLTRRDPELLRLPVQEERMLLGEEQPDHARGWRRRIRDIEGDIEVLRDRAARYRRDAGVRPP